ncbi:MAG: glutamate--tRNA ligase family protein [Evtepia gabavorous]
MATNATVRGRFAPSPSGRGVHLGNLVCCPAGLAGSLVRHLGGRAAPRDGGFLEPDRCRPEYLSQLADDLIWLGLDWDLGWRPGETAYCQSCRTPFYQAAFKPLASRGLVYPLLCCGRKRAFGRLAPRRRAGARIYSGRCRRLSAEENRPPKKSGRSPAWRVQVPGEIISFVDEVFGPQQERLDRDCGDFALRRSDGIYAYQLAVAEDDGRMGVTRVVRGWDLLSSTPPGRFGCWNRKLRLPDPDLLPLFPCAKSPAGRRLSKRDRDLDMGSSASAYHPGKTGGASGLSRRADSPAHGPAPSLTWSRNSPWSKVGQSRPDRWTTESGRHFL